MRQLKWREYELVREPFEPAVLEYRDKTGKHSVELNCGSHDEVEVFRERSFTYVLSWNDRLGYVGLERFLGWDKDGEVFLQNSQDVAECLGKKGLDLTPMTMVKRLAEYLG